MKLNKLVLTMVLLGLGFTAFGTVSAKTAEMGTTAKKATAKNAEFEALSNQFLEALWQLSPEWAVSVGYYKYADQLPIPDAQSRTDAQNFSELWLKRLHAIKLSSLSPNQQADYSLIENQLLSLQWYNTEFKSWQWNPAEYNVADGFSVIFTTEYAPLDTRLKTILARLVNVPAYYAAAKTNIVQPSAEHTQLAIEQNNGALSVFGDDLQKAVAQSMLSTEEKNLFGQRINAAKAAITDYVQWLKSLQTGFTDSNTRSFRIGPSLYEKKFAYDIQSNLSAEQMYQRAIREKNAAHERMSKLADELWPRYMGERVKPAEPLQKIEQLIEVMSVHHVQADKFVDEVKLQIPALEKWVRDHHLLALDPSRPLVVRETPEYMRGVTVASVNAPGPYDPKANTYYNVTPLDLTQPEKTESWLREYNDWILQVLSIHEGVPGHYVQLLYANKSPSLIKSILGNGAMIEGWAVYSERLMMESGFGGNTPEMWLMYSKWNLRAVCNTILDYQVHTQNMSKEDAVQFLMREAFQSRSEAEGKWRRVQLTSVQLTSYFSGYADIYDLREQLKQKQGTQFNLTKFNEQFLSYGSAPVRVIKQMMMP